MRKGLLAMLVMGVIGVTPLVTATAAHAYGSKALYQIGLSANCDNPDICGSDGLGGFWGWAEFDSDNTADAQFAGCGHLQGGPGGGGGGAGHLAIDATGWYIGSNGDFFVTSEVDTYTGHGPPVKVVIESEDSDTGIPATPGHYSTEDLMGFTAPGVSFQIQVVKIPGH